MIVTDLDGTLFNSNSELSEGNRLVLNELADKNITRVVATGRILYSVQAVMDEDFPIDYLIFSSGAGIIDFKNMELIYACSMSDKDIYNSTLLLKDLKLDFMVHAPVPDNHHCLYSFHNASPGDDFERRLGIYEDFAQEWNGSLSHLEDWENCASLIIASVPAEQGEEYQNMIKKELSDVHVVRTSSPLNKDYNWIEILPPGVSKANAAKWLMEHINHQGKVMAIGNDYNDIDLLNWGDPSYVVSNAPELLKTSYEVVASNDEDGFAQAVKDFIG